MDPEPGLAWGLVGTHQDLLGGYEAGFLLIADRERVADCGPSLIALPTMHGHSETGFPVAGDAERPFRGDGSGAVAAASPYACGEELGGGWAGQVVAGGCTLHPRAVGFKPLAPGSWAGGARGLLVRA